MRFLLPYPNHPVTPQTSQVVTPSQRADIDLLKKDPAAQGEGRAGEERQAAGGAGGQEEGQRGNRWRRRDGGRPRRRRRHPPLLQRRARPREAVRHVEDAEADPRRPRRGAAQGEGAVGGRPAQGQAAGDLLGQERAQVGFQKCWLSFSCSSLLQFTFAFAVSR